MNEGNIQKIIGIIHDIKHFDKELHDMQNWDDEVGKLMRFQYQHSKEQLLKELMVELVNSNIDFREIEVYLNGLTNYLSQNGSQGEKLPEIALTNLREIQRLVAVA